MKTENWLKYLPVAELAPLEEKAQNIWDKKEAQYEKVESLKQELMEFTNKLREQENLFISLEAEHRKACEDIRQLLHRWETERARMLGSEDKSE